MRFPRLLALLGVFAPIPVHAAVITLDDASLESAYTMTADNTGSFWTIVDGLVDDIVVDGHINFLTFTSWMIVDGPAPIEGVYLDFPLWMDTWDDVEGSGRIPYGWTGALHTTTLDFTNRNGDVDFRPVALTNISLVARGDNNAWFRPYWLSQGGVDVTFHYGVTITGVDYTPNTGPLSVPEPAALSLVALGACALLRRRH